jgi:hypothetical protein
MPGSDTLTGVCHCGAEKRADGPIEVWEWLLAHDEHEPSTQAPHEPGRVTYEGAGK